MEYTVNIYESTQSGVSRDSLKGIKYDITDNILYIGSKNEYIIFDIMTCFDYIYNSSENKHAYILDEQGKHKRLTYDMIKGVTIKYLPSNYKYEILLESGGVGIIVKIMSYDKTYNDPYINSIIYVASSAIGALKTITFNGNYVSDNFTDGTLNLKTSYMFRLLISRPVIKGMNIVLYTNIDFLRSQDNNIIFLFPISRHCNFSNCNIIDIVNSKVYNDKMECIGSIHEICYIDKDGIIKSTAKGYCDGGKLVLLPDLIDYDKIIK